MFFHLHIWLHTVLSNSIISSSTDQSQESLQGNAQANNGADLSSPIDQLSRSGAKLVAEYLSFCTIVNPAIYYTHPFLGQPLFTAGRVIMDGEWTRGAIPGHHLSFHKILWKIG